MTINVFEGARRIALLIAGLWVVGWIAYAAFNDTSYSIVYSVEKPGAPPKPATTCGEDDDFQYLTKEAPNGESFSTMLCFAKRRADDSDEFKTYKANVIEQFQLTADASSLAKASRPRAVLEQWRDAAYFLFGGLAAGWVLAAALGWIFRGFMGIPRGKDARPEKT